MQAPTSTLIARGPHLRALRERGLAVRSVSGDFTVSLPATDDPAEIGQVDVVLFCVKSYDSEAAAEKLHPLVQEETAVVLLQNGIDNEERSPPRSAGGMSSPVRPSSSPRSRSRE